MVLTLVNDTRHCKRESHHIRGGVRPTECPCAAHRGDMVLFLNGPHSDDDGGRLAVVILLWGGLGVFAGPEVFGRSISLTHSPLPGLCNSEGSDTRTSRRLHKLGPTIAIPRLKPWCSKQPKVGPMRIYFRPPKYRHYS